NVKAVYRTGIGFPGNVRAGQISLLATRPLGVKGVVNPLAATGGADRETADDARDNISRRAAALDRLVSVQDYEDYARAFAGLGKARATRRPRHGRLGVHLTIAGAGDAAIDETSDLYKSLVRSLRLNGDPSEPVEVAIRLRVVLVVEIHVRLLPRYLWE